MSLRILVKKIPADIYIWNYILSRDSGKDIQAVEMTRH